MMIHILVIHPFYIIADEAFRENEWAEAANALLSEMVSIRNQIKIANTLDIQLANDVLLKMVKVEKGTFMMGEEDNYFRHEVTISHDYWIGCYEITRIQYNTIMKNDSKWLIQNDEELPQVNVSWAMANEFCKKLNYHCIGKLPKGYYCTLPTEAQWEYAARGGKHSKNYLYSGGDDPQKVAQFQMKMEKNPQKVGLKQPNELGISDMSGNVWEWCLDRFAEYPVEPVTDPQGPNNMSFWKGKGRVRRGGCWKSQEEDCRITYRYYADPSMRVADIGFRVVLVWDGKDPIWDERGKKLEEFIDNANDKFNDFRDKHLNN